MTFFNKITTKIYNYIKPNNYKISNIDFIIDKIFFPKLYFLRLSRKFLKIKNFSINKIIQSIQSTESEDYCFIKKNQNVDETIFKASLSLRNNGLVIIENAFSNNEVDELRKIVDNYIPELKRRESSNYENYNNKLVPLIYDKFLLSPIITETIERSINLNKNNDEFVRVRENSRVIWFNATKKNIENNWTSGWHIDFPTQFAVHVILEDTNINCTRMQAIPRTQDFFLLSGRHYNLDDFIKKNKLEDKVVNFCGKKGTLYIHSGNILHRNMPVINTSRYLWGATYTADKVFYLNDREKSKEFFLDSENFISNMSLNDKKRIEGLLFTKKEENFEKGYFKLFGNNNFKKAKKSDLTYL